MLEKTLKNYLKIKKNLKRNSKSSQKKEMNLMRKQGNINI